MCKATKLSSLITVAYVVLLGDTARGMFFPILWPMVTAMGSDKVMLGYCVGLFSFGRLISSPFFGYLADSKGTCVALRISCTVVCVGSIMFACVRTSEPSHLYLLMMAQTLLGVGSGTLGVTRAYYAENSSKQTRTVMLARLTAVQYMGFTVMPVLGSGLYALGDLTRESGMRIFTQHSAPAVFVAIMSVAAVVLLYTYYDPCTESQNAKPLIRSLAYSSVPTSDTSASDSDMHTYVDTEMPSVQAENGPHSPQPSKWQLEMALFSMCALNFSSRGAIAVYETLGAAYAYEKFNLSTGTVGLLFSGFGACGMLVLLSFPWLMKVVDDVTLINSGLAIMSCATGILVNYGSPTSLHLFIVSVFLMYTIGYPTGNTAVIGAFSKISKSTKQGLLLGYFASAGSLARVIFPIISGYTSTEFGPAVAFLVALATLVFSLGATLYKASTIRAMAA